MANSGAKRLAISSMGVKPKKGKALEKELASAFGGMNTRTALAKKKK